MEWETPAIQIYVGNSRDFSLMLYLFERGSRTVGQMRADGVCSQDAALRIIAQKLHLGLIELDTDRRGRGNYYRLTKRGRTTALKISEWNQWAEQNPPPRITFLD